MKSLRREKKRQRQKSKWVKHGFGKWEGINGLSKAYIKILKSKMGG